MEWFLADKLDSKNDKLTYYMNGIQNKIILGIDASNIQIGGGLTHLRELLRNCNPVKFGFEKVIIWSSAKTLDRLNNYSWLEKRNHSLLNRSLPFRIFWQQFILAEQLINENCALLFSPGGTIPLAISIPTVTMSQNMLPFEKKERKRFKNKAYRFKFFILSLIQGYSLKKASGLIFLSDYAKKYIQNSLNQKFNESPTIPHGIDSRFMMAPRVPKKIENCFESIPLQLLYVSTIDVYKHQWQVVEAVALLRQKGIPVTINFIGPDNPKAPEAMMLFEASIKEHDESQSFIKYSGPIDFDELEHYYQEADIFVFASSCENLPNILLEAMASGLPIASSDKGPMPEVLGSFAEFFNPESAESISIALINLIVSPELRKKNADALFARAHAYSWEKCARDTFEFLHYIHKKYGKEHS